MSGPIHWAAISRNDCVLAEARSPGGDSARVQEVAYKLLHKKITPGWEYASSRGYGLRGVKFHVLEKSGSHSPPLAWVFAVVTNSSLEDVCVKSFLEKLVYITEPMRVSDPLWRQGQVLAVQDSFLPTLRQRMEQIPSKTLDVDGIRTIMSRNIDALLGTGRSDEYADNHENDGQASMSHQLRDWNEQVNRFKMMQYAKHGRILGSIITAAVLFLPSP
jgi:hypothetical protein